MTKELLFEESDEELISYSDDSLFNIISFGNDMNLRQIVEMYKDGDIEKPDLQRKYVWTKTEASRFIDSVLLGLPVPSVFLAKREDNRLLIIDGYQRIMSIFDYMRGIFSGDNKVFRLSNSESINSKWRGKAYSELSEELKRSIRTYTIHAIIFEQKSPKNDTAMYQIFERINTGGRVLRPQEIRNCIYHGSFNNLLTELNRNEKWRILLNLKKEDPRMSDIELILRFFAFIDLVKMEEYNTYQINLSKYLNAYMFSLQEIDAYTLQNYKDKFIRTIEFLYKHIGENCFKSCKVSGNKTVWSKKINPVIFDAVCFATDKYLNDTSDVDSKKSLKRAYKRLVTNPEFKSITTQRTTKVDNIKKRQNIAYKILFENENDR